MSGASAGAGVEIVKEVETQYDLSIGFPKNMVETLEWTMEWKLSSTRLSLTLTRLNTVVRIYKSFLRITRAF